MPSECKLSDSVQGVMEENLSAGVIGKLLRTDRDPLYIFDGKGYKLTKQGKGIFKMDWKDVTDGTPRVKMASTMTNDVEAFMSKEGAPAAPAAHRMFERRWNFLPVISIFKRKDKVDLLASTMSRKEGDDDHKGMTQTTKLKASYFPATPYMIGTWEGHLGG